MGKFEPDGRNCDYWATRAHQTLSRDVNFTDDPQSADFFFVPMHCLMPKSIADAQVVEARLIEAMERVGPFWREQQERHIVTRQACPPKNSEVNTIWRTIFSSHGPFKIFKVDYFVRLYVSKAIIMCSSAVVCPEERDSYRTLMVPYLDSPT